MSRAPPKAGPVYLLPLEPLRRERERDDPRLAAPNQHDRTVLDLASQGRERKELSFQRQRAPHVAHFLAPQLHAAIRAGRGPVPALHYETPQGSVDVSAEVDPRDGFLSSVAALYVRDRPQLVIADFLREGLV